MSLNRSVKAGYHAILCNAFCVPVIHKNPIKRMTIKQDNLSSAIIYVLAKTLSAYKSRREKTQKRTQLSPRSHPRHLVGKRTKRRHQRYHQRQPGEQLFPIQVVTG